MDVKDKSGKTITVPIQGVTGDEKVFTLDLNILRAQGLNLTEIVYIYIVAAGENKTGIFEFNWIPGTASGLERVVTSTGEAASAINIPYTDLNYPEVGSGAQGGASSIITPTTRGILVEYQTGPYAAVISDTVEQGKIAGELLEKALLDSGKEMKGSIVYQTLPFMHPNAATRAKSFKDVFTKYPDVKIIELTGISPEDHYNAFDGAIKATPELSIAYWNLALALLETGQWERGWKEHEWGLQSVKGQHIMRVDRKVGDLPYWDGTPNEPVLVYGEQGIGDEIMFSSMIPDLLKTNPIVLESHKRLTTLFSKSFNVPVYVFAD